MNFYSHKKLVVSLLGASAALVVGSVSAAPINSIAESWHNLGAGNSKATTPNNGTPSNHSNATGEICVFCHTPHGADAGASVPIWNRSISNPPTYTRYSDLGTSTFDAAEAPIGSITIGCLSCHDGTQAMDALLNAPGSGNYTPPGPGANPTPLGNFVGADQAGGILIDGIVQNLGTDLSNDHPVSMQYGGGGITDAVTPLATNDPDFIMPIKGTLGTGASVWYIPGEETALRIGGDAYLNASSLNPAGRDRLDIILYSRDEPTVEGGLQPFVECGSCHDPHNVDNPTFLRISNSNPATAGFEDWANGNGGPSALCLTCHDK